MCHLPPVPTFAAPGELRQRTESRPRSLPGRGPGQEARAALSGASRGPGPGAVAGREPERDGAAGGAMILIARRAYRVTAGPCQSRASGRHGGVTARRGGGMRRRGRPQCHDAHCQVCIGSESRSLSAAGPVAVSPGAGRAGAGAARRAARGCGGLAFQVVAGAWSGVSGRRRRDGAAGGAAAAPWRGARTGTATARPPRGTRYRLSLSSLKVSPL